MSTERKLYLTLVVSLLLCSSAVAQTIYKSEKNGVTSYSTKPSPDANAVKLPGLSVIPVSTPVSSQQNSMASMPAMPVPDSIIPGKNGMLLPPPPPSLGIKSLGSGQPQQNAQMRTREELQNQLTKARSELTAQDEIRLGDERNYQKKLDRIKPYQEKVEELSKALGVPL